MKKQTRLPDPKIVPAPDQRVDMTVEFTIDEFPMVEELARALDCWTIEELLRTVSRLLVQSEISTDSLLRDSETR